MSTPRGSVGVAILDRKIYVTGGSPRGIGRTISHAECYDPTTDTWSQVANMNIARQGHCLVSLHGRLYAIGGYRTDSLEVYDPDNNSWTLLQHKLDGTVYGNGAGLIKKDYLKK